MTGEMEAHQKVENRESAVAHKLGKGDRKHFQLALRSQEEKYCKGHQWGRNFSSTRVVFKQQKEGLAHSDLFQLSMQHIWEEGIRIK